jgi:hypothetical protein
MRMLVLAPVLDLDTPLTTGFVALNEPALRQLVERLLDVHVVVCQQLRLQLLGPVQQASVAVSHGPQSGEEQAHDRLQLAKRIVCEEPWADIARTWHSAVSRLCREGATDHMEIRNPLISVLRQIPGPNLPSDVADAFGNNLRRIPSQ